MRTSYRIASVLFFLCFCLFAVISVTAQDAAPSEPVVDAAAEAEKLLVVPEGTPAELLEHIKSTMMQIRGLGLETQEEQDAFLRKWTAFCVQVADKVLAQNPEPKEKKEACQLKLQGLLLSTIGPFADKNSGKKAELLAFAEELAKMDDPELSVQGKMLPLLLQIIDLGESKDFINDATALRTKILDFVKANETPEMVSLLLQFVMGCDQQGPEKETAAFLKETEELFRPILEKQNPQLGQFLDMTLERSTRNAALIGQEMKLEGLDITGQKFEISSLRGKVVLVDFWATWCAPCLAEVPNMKKAYEKYKDKGFEIVGYSIDEDVDALKAFLAEEKTPWTVLSGTMSVAANLEDVAETYQIEGIPAMFLLDKEGKIISTKARGENLNKKLEEIFGK